MVFSSLTFLIGFLPTVLVIYYVLPHRWRVAWLTGASYVFYLWDRPEFLPVLLLVTLWSYGCSFGLGANRRVWVRKVSLTLSVIGCLSVLGFFKYAGMLSVWADSFCIAMGLLESGQTWFTVRALPLPIGISFFTFQALSYTVDLYRGQARPTRNLLTYCCYIALFAQLIAGPIVRYQDISEQFEQRAHTPAKFGLGFRFFVLGLAKKVILADTFALAVPAAFGDHQPGFAGAWTGVLGYTLQIYFDFSAYSDMAVGLGLMMGFCLPINFDSPYKSASITEFWRRWHISLSTWLRDYLFIPLGGSRGGAWKTYRNLTVVMLLGGIWHGASSLFLVWGALHGALLSAERSLGSKHPLVWLPRPAAVVLTGFLVLVGWVVFRAEDWSMAGGVYAGMVGAEGGWLGGGGLELIAWPLIWTIPVGLGICWFMRNTWQMDARPRPVLVARDGLLLVLCMIAVVSRDATPFLYFQF